MKDPATSEAGGTAHLVERQMLLYNTRRRLAPESTAEQSTGHYRFVTISREVGALGDLIASDLAARLGWQVFDKEIVDYIARHGHVRQDLVRQMDEKAQSLVHDTVDRILRMFQGGAFGNEEYHVALLKTLGTFAAQGGAILLGRGAAFALQGQAGLHVRITASLAVRVQRLSARWQVSPEEARKRIVRIDEERRNFIQYHFKQNQEDVRFFDLIFSTDRLGGQQVASSVMGVLQLPEPGHKPGAHPSMPPPRTASHEPYRKSLMPGRE